MPAFAPHFTISNGITAGLTEIERARGFLEAATLSDEWVRRMSQRDLIVADAGNGGSWGAVW